MQSHNKKIFISYQRDHEEDITALVTALEREGKYDVWYDQKMIRGKWWDNILEAIRDADVVILALSPSYLKSEPCRLERDYATALRKAIVPVRVDENLDHRAIPHEIVVLQINDYYGRTEQFQTLEDVLDLEQSPPLPDPLPKEPDVPIGSSESSTNGKSSSIINQVLLIGGGVIVLGIMIAVFIMSQSGTDSIPPVETVVNTPTTTVNTPVTVTGEVGDFSLELIYGGLDSFIVHITDTSNLYDVTLNTSDGAQEILLTRFPDLAIFGDAIPAGICLVYAREDSRPVLPLNCDTDQVQRLTVSPGDVFWYDDGTNLYNNIVLRQSDGEGVTRLCPHQNGSGSCSISTTE